MKSYIYIYIPSSKDTRTVDIEENVGNCLDSIKNRNLLDVSPSSRYLKQNKNNKYLRLTNCPLGVQKEKMIGLLKKKNPP